MLKRSTTPLELSSQWLVPQVPPAPKVTPQKLKRAARLSQQIEQLRRELDRLLTGTTK